MVFLGAASVFILAAWLGVHVFWIARFNAAIRASRPCRVPDDALPKVAVVLSLRGADPFLDRCLAGLFAQDYPDYDVRIVIDCATDPAWDVVERAVARHRAHNVTIEALKAARRTCSLKNSSLIQAVANLDRSHGAVVVVDADVVPYANWLRDLVGPLVRPGVGATSGVRWFMPETADVGSLVRYLWNSAAILQMRAFGIGWGGSLAIRADLLRDAELIEKWSKILFEDTFTANELQRLGHKLEFVPAATMVNRESIDLAGSVRFITRQLLNVRLYHDSWRAILWLTALTTLASVTVCATAAWGAVIGQWAVAAALGTCAAAFPAAFTLLLLWLEGAVRKSVRSRGEATPPLSWHVVWALPFTQFAYVGCVLWALRKRKVEWRGITYRLHAPHRIRLIKYSPYQPAKSESVPLSL